MVMEEQTHHLGVVSNPMEPDPGKMFIGGLNNQTTADSLRRYFEQFGEIKECVVMRDGVTKRSRGFGFVRFTDSKSVDQVQKNANVHTVDGKKVDPKRAIPKRPPVGQNQFKKVFVGGLPPDISIPELKQYFEVFGKVTEVLLMHDRNTKRLRGFGFVTFESDAAGKHVCETGFHKLKGKNVECKKAQPKEVMMLQGKGRAFIGNNIVNFAPFTYARSYPNGMASNSVGFEFPGLMQYDRVRGYPTSQGTPQGYISLPDHRRSSYYTEYGNLQPISGEFRPTDISPNHPTNDVTTTNLTQHYEPSSVLTAYGSGTNTVVTSPLTQTFTQTTSQQQGGELGGYLTTGSSAHTHDQHIYASRPLPASSQGLFAHGLTQITLRH